jgi:hypothetical protein
LAPQLVDFSQGVSNMNAFENALANLAFMMAFTWQFFVFAGVGSLMAGAICWAIPVVLRTPRARFKALRLLLGGLCLSAVLATLYVPRSPDECSRTLTDEKYETCISNLLSGKDIQQASSWLKDRDYTTSVVTADASENNAKYKPQGEAPLVLKARRNQPYPYAIPYGTVFNRLFARLGPAPKTYRLNVYGSHENNTVSHVKSNWKYSML